MLEDRWRHVGPQRDNHEELVSDGLYIPCPHAIGIIGGAVLALKASTSENAGRSSLCWGVTPSLFCPKGGNRIDPCSPESRDQRGDKGYGGQDQTDGEHHEGLEDGDLEEF